MYKHQKQIPCLFAVLQIGLCFLRAGEVFPVNTPWHYLKGTNEASVPSTAWRQIEFDDADWLIGNAPFFYENSSGYTGNTELTDMLGAYSSVYLRKTFTLANPGDVLSLQLNVQSDDGAILWINGVEVERINMADGEKSFDDLANGSAGEPNSTSTVIPDASGLLQAGTNVVAIHAFNASLSDSSDFLISASLSSTVDDQAPVLVDIAPPPAATVRALTEIEVVFDDNVTGVDASDLLINGTPATQLTVYSPRNYLFGFAQPTSGLVHVAWGAGHGITDLASTPNPFGGGSWSYTLDPSLPEDLLIISEFMADNEDTIDDEDGDSSDWIELHNIGSEPMDLEGWSLTDESGDLRKWLFPSLTLAPNQYLLIWASEKNRTNPLAPLHANFKLDKDGEYLALVNPGTNIVSEFAPRYPEQRADVSFGRDRVDPAILGYFETPTPGAPNATSGAGFAPDPVCSPEGGVYDTSSLAVTLAAPLGAIRYTVDGTQPSPSSPLYVAPIPITGGMVVKARVFEPGLLPSRIVVHAFNLVGTGLNTFSSNLPLLILNTSGRGIPQDSRIPATVTVIDTFRGRSSLKVVPQFQGLCQVEVRGQTSAGFPKKPYNLEINDPFGDDLEVSLLGLPAESDWVLYNPYSDKSFLNNYLAFELHEKMGHYAVRRRFVEVFVDTSGGSLNYPQDYMGIYVLLEKIKIDNNRVDLTPLRPMDSSEPDVSGGYIVKKDKSSPGDITFGTSGGAGFGGQSLRYHEPKPREITSVQQTWIRNYLNQFESVLYSPNWLSATGPSHYSHYIDVDSFVDYHWIVEFSKQIDGYRLSNYMSKDREGKLRMEPIWDWNLSFGNANYLEGGRVSGWYYPLIGDTEHIWLRRLINGTTSGSGTSGDPDFNQKIIDRWSVLRTNILNGPNVIVRVNQIANMLNEAQERDFAKWPRLGSYVWPNPDSSWDVDFVSPNSYAALIDQKKNYISGRFSWIDAQFTQAPAFSRPEGRITAGSILTITAPAGTIYYTMNGTDPRGSGGTLASGAIAYQGPITLNNNVRVLARARNGTDWSGPTAATFYLNLPPLIVSEIMYHPEPPPPGSPYEESDFEFIELKNIGASTLSLYGVQFVNGLQFNFSEGSILSLAPSQRLLLVRNQSAFISRYGSLPGIAGVYTGSLANEGERLTLLGRYLEPVLDFRFDDDWYPITDGYGFSLVPANETSPNVTWDEKSSWCPSGAVQGSPGVADPSPTLHPSVLINEALTHTDLPQLDSVELRNLGLGPVDLSGWFLTDDRDQPKKFRIPDNTFIGGNDYLVFDENDFNLTNGFNVPFQLNSTGDELFLFSADVDGRLTGYFHGFDFGAAPNNVSFGRHVTSTGDDHFVAQSIGTLGAANAAPRVGPVVINEIMYHPPDVYVNGAFWDNTEDEFIELHNITSTPVALFDTLFPTNTWKLRDAVRYTFPTNLVVPAGGFLVVVNFDPENDSAQLAAFRAQYALGPQVQILGPYRGKLNNSSDSVELVRPDQPNLPPVPLPWVLVDKVRYADLAPWPSGPDGQGPSLQRSIPSEYGNDPANWFSGGFSPGTTNAVNQPPTVTLLSPADGAVVQWPDFVQMEAEAADEEGGIFRVEFYAGTSKIGEDTTIPYTFSWTNATSGLYELFAVARDTRGGFATSSVVRVVMVSPTPEPITLLPAGAPWKYLDNGTDQGIQWRQLSFDDSTWDLGPAQLGYGEGDEATVVSFGPNSSDKYPTTYFRHVFTVEDASAVMELTLRLLRDDGAIAYLNGVEVFRSNMPTGPVGYRDYAAGTVGGGEESTFYSTALNPALLQTGQNVLAVEIHQANATSSDISFDAELSGLLLGFALPRLTVHPQSRTVSAGSNVVFTVVAVSDLPLSYQWFHNGTILSEATNATLLITNVHLDQQGLYQVQVSNAIDAVLSDPATLVVLVPPQVVEHPISQVVAVGSPVTFRIVCNGTLPMGYRWHHSGTILTNMVLNSHTSILTIPSVTMEDAGTYFVILTNAAFYTPGVRSRSATLTLTGDSDLDGLPDTWELANGLDPNNPNDAGDDADGDGMSNRNEYVAGTDPQNPDSYLKVDNLAAGTTVLITFLAISNKTYTVQYADQLFGGPWGRVNDVLSRATNFTATVIDPSPAPKRFYRLVTPRLAP